MDYPVAVLSQLPHYLRSLRKVKGLTQTELAKRLGVGQSRVADIEANPGKVSVEQLLQVLALLNAQMVVRHEQPTASGAAASTESAGPKSDSPHGLW